MGRSSRSNAPTTHASSLPKLLEGRVKLSVWPLPERKKKAFTNQLWSTNGQLWLSELYKARKLEIFGRRLIYKNQKAFNEEKDTWMP
jgi:hypothetical protein